MKNCLKRVLTAHALLSTIVLAACEEEPMAAYAPRGIEDDGGQEESDAGLTDDGSGTYILPDPRILTWQALPLDTPRIAMGNDHSCAIDLDKRVRCWGWNGEGQSVPPEDLENVERIAAGTFLSCAITDEDALVCWGGQSIEFPHLNGPPPEGNFREVGVGSFHACAIDTDDGIVCWGSNEYGQRDAPQGAFHKLTVSEAHSCALELETNRPVCWGRGSEEGAAAPPEGLVLRSISAGSIHTCGIKEDRKPVCWGPGVDAGSCDNIALESAHCGQGDPPDREMLMISSGFSHSCAIMPGAKPVCWGSDVYDQSSIPAGRFTQIASGVDHSCGVTLTGALRCWGQDNQGKTTPPADFFPED